MFSFAAEDSTYFLNTDRSEPQTPGTWKWSTELNQPLGHGAAAPSPCPEKV